MPSVTFLQYICTVFLWKYLKNTAGFRKILFFLYVYYYTCVLHTGWKYCFLCKILFFRPKNTANLFARWHPCFSEAMSFSKCFTFSTPSFFWTQQNSHLTASRSADRALALKTKTMWTNGAIHYATVDSPGCPEAKNSCCSKDR